MSKDILTWMQDHPSPQVEIRMTVTTPEGTYSVVKRVSATLWEAQYPHFRGVEIRRVAEAMAEKVDRDSRDV